MSLFYLTNHYSIVIAPFFIYNLLESFKGFSKISLDIAFEVFCNMTGRHLYLLGIYLAKFS